MSKWLNRIFKLQSLNEIKEHILGAHDGEHELQTRLVLDILPLLHGSGGDLCLVLAVASEGRLDPGGI